MLRTSAKLGLTVFAMLLAAVSTTHAGVISTGTAGLGVPETNWSVAEIAPNSIPLLGSFGVSGAKDYPGAWVAAPTGSNWISPYIDISTSTAIDDPDSKGPAS